MPLTQLASMMNVFQSGIASLERVLELLDADGAVARRRPTPTPAPVRGRVEFRRRVRSPTTRTGRSSRRCRSSPSRARRSPSSGPTGAGKTTLVNLIMRFYELDGGSITLDGRDIAVDARGTSCARNIGMVLQDTWLFGGTIRDNIAYGNPDATEEQILEAAKATLRRPLRALAARRLRHRHQRGGRQHQRRARSSCSRSPGPSSPTAPILILDEATSSVDTRTEVQVQEAMNRAARRTAPAS